MINQTIDFEAKRQAMLNLWQDMFDLCVNLVAEAKAGKQSLKASMLKEMNQFLRLSEDVLNSARKHDEEQKSHEEQERQAREHVEMMNRPPEGMDLSSGAALLGGYIFPEMPAIKDQSHTLKEAQPLPLRTEPWT